MTALYNDVEPYVCQWMRNLIDDGQIAPGAVDERSIAELTPDDVRAATQFHAFAGIGVWSYALRLAGWPDDLPVWTGSCPCQPFSAAGRKNGFDDARHVWPEWFRLIQECRPPIVIGEQVASPDGLEWLDAVFADLEGAGYACAASDLCASSLGAPHERQRLYFVAYTRSDERGPWWNGRADGDWTEQLARRCDAGRLGHTDGEGSQGRDGEQRSGERISREASASGGMAHGADERRERDTRTGREAVGGTQHDGTVGGLAHGKTKRQQRDRSTRRGRARSANDGAVGGLADDDSLARGQSGALTGGSGEGSDAVEGTGPRSGSGARGMADSDSEGRSVERVESAEDGHAQSGDDADGRSEARGDRSGVGGVGDADRRRLARQPGPGGVSSAEESSASGIDGGDRTQHAGASSGMGDGDRQYAGELPAHEGQYEIRAKSSDHPSVFAGATRGYWAGADWLYCRDEKWRPTEPGAQPLVVGAPSRVVEGGAVETQPRSGALKGYGNSIVAQVAATFIRAAMEAIAEVEGKRA